MALGYYKLILTVHLRNKSGTIIHGGSRHFQYDFMKGCACSCLWYATGLSLTNQLSARAKSIFLIGLKRVASRFGKPDECCKRRMEQV